MIMLTLIDFWRRVVLIAEKQAPGSLTKINSVMRRIDLSCKLLAPIVVGFMMSSVSVLASPVLIAVWNIISVGIEYWLLHHVYVSMPALQQKSTAHQAYQASSQFAESNAEEVELSVFERDNMSQVFESFPSLSFQLQASVRNCS